nr:unnamed protein product [Callosobruchus chinensis]
MQSRLGQFDSSVTRP